VIGVSGDSMETNLKFKAENGIDFPMVSDTDKSIKNRYGRGRVTYLIDKQGIIQMIQAGVPDNPAFLKKLKQLP
jgi:peroxiredoxin